MKIDFIGNPSAEHWEELCALWKEAFGDSDEFLQIFYRTAFQPERCCCLFTEGQLAAALYWFDCSFQEKPVAYLYAIATAKAYQNRGLCHQLMGYVHKHLHDRGYVGALLVPASSALRNFYKKMGYKTCTYISHIACELAKSAPPVIPHTPLDGKVFANMPASSELSGCMVMPESSCTTISNEWSENVVMSETSAIHIQELDKLEYAQLRRKYLPSNSVLQEKENLDFLETQMHFFYINYDFSTQNNTVAPNEPYIKCSSYKNYICSVTPTLIAANKCGSQLHAVEILGNRTCLPQILNAFDCQQGRFQFPGNEIPFAMWLPFQKLDTEPEYFGFAFD